MDQAVATAAIALGSNLGDRAAHLRYAVARLDGILHDIRVSTFRETDPVGVSPQPPFLNGAVAGHTSLAPGELLDLLLQIEQDAGRQRPHLGAPRSLDLDLILHGTIVIETPHVILPHPRFRERAFVLEPLAEIAPALVDPVTGKTMAELWDQLGQAPSRGQRPEE